MAKKSRAKRESVPEELPSRSTGLKEETLFAIYGIICLVAALFFVLAYFEKAGTVGTYIKKTFDLLLGIGYILLPLVLLMQAVAFFRSIRKSFSLFQITGSLLFLISSLGVIHTLFPEHAGILGRTISVPLVKAVDFYATLAILGATLIVSVLVIFDTHLRIGSLLSLFKKEPKLEEDTDEEPAPETTPIKVAAKPIPEPEEDITPAYQDLDIEPEEKPLPKEKRLEKKITIRPYTPPPLTLLERDRGKPGVGDVKANTNIIKRTLQTFGISVEMDEVSIGPSVTRYALKPAEGVKLSRIVGLQNDLSLALAAHPLRIEAPIPGKSLVGIEVPNVSKTTVGLATLLSEEEYQSSEKPLLVSLGKGISGKSHFANLAKAPHLLIAGATGSGKSVTIHAILTSLLYRNSPEQLKFIMIDPKRVELTLYNNIPHLLTPVITDAKKAILSLKWATKEMERRYNVLEKRQVRDIESYHKNVLIPHLEKLKKGEVAEDIEKDDENSPETMPYIVVIIDELADIMQAYPRELESGIVRLAQMSRAVGIHLILSTQRPSVNVITGLIKANVPSRIALQVTSQIDSRTILDTGGAEKLLGAGDMLFMSGDMAKPARVQSAFISEQELKKVVDYLINNYKDEIPSEIDLSPQAVADKNAIFDASLEDEPDDELYEEAKQTVMETGKASTSFLQRKFSIGYARAARLIDLLEEKGVIGPGSGAKPREVFMRQGAPTATEEPLE